MMLCGLADFQKHEVITNGWLSVACLLMPPCHGPSVLLPGRAGGALVPELQTSVLSQWVGVGGFAFSDHLSCPPEPKLEERRPSCVQQLSSLADSIEDKRFLLRRSDFQLKG